jgi:hypothetical protein
MVGTYCIYSSLCCVVSTQMRNLPVWKWHSHFQLWHPFPVLSFYGSHFWTRSCVVNTQTCNLPVLEMAFPFPVMAPISSTVLLRIPLLEMFHLVRYPNWQSAITGTGRDSFVPFPVLGVPFPVLGYAIFSTVIHWAPYRNWTLCAWSHSLYRPLPVRYGHF